MIDANGGPNGELRRHVRTHITCSIRKSSGTYMSALSSITSPLSNVHVTSPLVLSRARYSHLSYKSDSVILSTQESRSLCGEHFVTTHTAPLCPTLHAPLSARRRAPPATFGTGYEQCSFPTRTSIISSACCPLKGKVSTIKCGLSSCGQADPPATNGAPSRRGRVSSPEQASNHPDTSSLRVITNDTADEGAESTTEPCVSATLEPSPSPEPSTGMRSTPSSGVITNAFIAQISERCDAGCQTAVSEALRADMVTGGCAFGAAPVNIGSFHALFVVCETAGGAVTAGAVEQVLADGLAGLGIDVLSVDNDRAVSL